MNSACNPIEHKAEHSHCAIKSQEKLAELENNGSSIFQIPVSVKVEFSFGKAKKKSPSLVLESGHSTTRNALNLELYDEVVYQDIGIKALLSKKATDKIWNIKHLRDAHIKVSFDFWYLKLPGQPTRDEPMWPKFNNLQLIFGEKSKHLLSFSLDDLSTQKVERNSNAGIGGDMSAVTLVFEKTIDGSFCEKQLHEIS